LYRNACEIRARNRARAVFPIVAESAGGHKDVPAEVLSLACPAARFGEASTTAKLKLYAIDLFEGGMFIATSCQKGLPL